MEFEMVFGNYDPAILAELKTQEIEVPPELTHESTEAIREILVEAEESAKPLYKTIQLVAQLPGMSSSLAEALVLTERAKAGNRARIKGYINRLEKVEWGLGRACAKSSYACSSYVGIHSLDKAFKLRNPLHSCCDCYWLPHIE